MVRELRIGAKNCALVRLTESAELTIQELGPWSYLCSNSQQLGIQSKVEPLGKRAAMRLSLAFVLDSIDALSR